MSGTGTCSSLVGGCIGLKRLNPKIKIIGIIPQKNHVQLGLRSRNELGASKFFPYAEKLCEKLMEVSNKDAWNYMVKLWNIGILFGMTGGTYIYGALEVAKELRKNGEEGAIVTLIPDSCEDHQNLYERYFPKILEKAFNKDF